MRRVRSREFEHTHGLTWLVLKVNARHVAGLKQCTRVAGHPREAKALVPSQTQQMGSVHRGLALPQLVPFPSIPRQLWLPLTSLASRPFPMLPPEAASPPALGSRAGLFLPLLSRIPEDTGTGHGRVRALSSHPMGPGQDGV